MNNKISFKLRFNRKDICKWAKRNPYDDELELMHVLGPKVRKQGFCSKQDLQTFCRWKSRRTQSRVAQNPADYIEEITRIALSTPNERLRIEILRLLYGVSWPSASVILHFCHGERYPILDFRALWSLGINSQQVTYNFDLWRQYTLHCRKLADEAKVSMRELDWALWQYSKVNQ